MPGCVVTATVSFFNTRSRRSPPAPRAKNVARDASAAGFDGGRLPDCVSLRGATDPGDGG